MRHRGLLLGLVASAAVLAPACTRNPNTEYVAGFSTQIQVPKYFKSIEVSVFVGNDKTQQLNPSPVGCEHIPVVNGVARLPKTFGVYRQTDAQSVMVSVIGFEDDAETVQKQRIDCAVNPATTEGKAQLLRRSRQSYRDAKVLYLPMPLKYACYGVSCGNAGDPQTGNPGQPEQTCVAGQCVSAKRSEFVFRDYSPDLAFGDSSACFSSNRCMADAVDPKVEDADKCIYSVPGTADGMNVRVIYEGLVTEMLDLDNVLPPGFDKLTDAEKAEVTADLSANQEGFSILGPGKFQLAPGLCAMTKTGAKTQHRILGIAASRACAPKSNPQPMCDEGVDILQPVENRVYLMLDRSVDMQQAFLGKIAVDQIFGVPLNDPVFSTTRVGFRWLPGSGGATCPAPAEFSKMDVDFQRPYATRDALAQLVGQQASFPLVSRTSLATALSSDGVYGKLKLDEGKFNRQAVFIITNARTGVGCDEPPTATTSITAAAAAALGPNKAGIKTYVLELGVEGETDPASQRRLDDDAQAKDLALAGGTEAFLSTGGTKESAGPVTALALNALISDLSSCVYERPLSVTDTSTLKIATNADPQEIPRNTNCSFATRDTADGWNLEANDSVIRICGASCTKVRTQTGALSGFAATRKAIAAGLDAGVATPETPPALFVTATAPVKKP